MSTPVVDLSTRLFGIPHQLNPIADPRVEEVSRTLGAGYAEKILTDAPVCTIIPGKPRYLPTSGKKTKNAVTAGALMAMNGGGFKNNSEIKSWLNASGDKAKDKFRLYDFEKCYFEYISFVNMLCRSGAALLGLNDKYELPHASSSSTTQSFYTYDWSNYKWSNSAKRSTVGTFLSNLKSKGSAGNQGIKTSDINSATYDSESFSSAFENVEFVQFYVDPESAATDSLSNSQSESQLKSLFDSNSGLLKELAFMMDSGAAGDKAADFSNFVSESMGSLGAFTEETLAGTPFSALGRIINLGGNVLKGENIMIPDIYQTTSYTKNYDLTVHLRSPYGSKLSYYLNIFVPLMHLMALAMPRATSANSFHSPFIVKAYIEGAWSCNLGLVQSITVSKAGEARSSDGFPLEVDVSLSIADLYADLTMNNAADIGSFVNNASLIDYLATNCGLSLSQPNYKSKVDMVVNTLFNLPGNIDSAVNIELENIHKVYSGMTSLIHT